MDNEPGVISGIVSHYFSASLALQCTSLAMLWGPPFFSVVIAARVRAEQGQLGWART
uniref:Uncharacterized protein n=1 Tax=Physcomitrium patens TaxID=3218 RepID=A0A2K1L068_PHYPA|nr:hypothetical protein PHYPA_002213 [Physcomitrium patens]